MQDKSLLAIFGPAWPGKLNIWSLAFCLPPQNLQLSGLDCTKASIPFRFMLHKAFSLFLSKENFETILIKNFELWNQFEIDRPKDAARKFKLWRFLSYFPSLWIFGAKFKLRRFLSNLSKSQYFSAKIQTLIKYFGLWNPLEIDRPENSEQVTVYNWHDSYL